MKSRPESPASVKIIGWFYVAGYVMIDNININMRRLMMYSLRLKEYFLFIPLILLFGAIGGCSLSDNKPKLLWEKTYTDKIRGIYISNDAGNVIVHTSKKILYLSPSGERLWEKGEGKNWGWIGGVGISDDGEYIVFQAALATEEAEQIKDFYTYYLDKTGKVIWSSKTLKGITSFSPDGKYIITGSALDEEMEVYNNRGILLWKTKTAGIWSIKFDPTGKFFFANEAGIGVLYSTAGDKIATFNAGMNPQICDNAQYILVQSIELDKRSSIYLYQRNGKLLKTLNGKGGCISQDGSLYIIVDKNRLRLIQREKDSVLWEIGVPDINTCSISRNNRFIFAVSRKGADEYSVIYIFDIKDKKKIKPLKINGLEKVRVTSDGKYFIVLQKGNKVRMFKNY